MLKRPRPSSPSPTRPDQYPPPPLDNTIHRAIKRRRTAAPVLDGFQRRDYDWTVDDGEDDYEYDDNLEGDEADHVEHRVSDKVYEHMNHVLHILHSEQRHRSRPQLRPQSQSQSQGSHVYRDRQSPVSSPVKYGQWPGSFMAPYPDHIESQENDEGVAQGRFHNLDEQDTSHKSGPLPIHVDERLRVMHRYEDTNRLLGSLVLSRRKQFFTPPPDAL